MSTRSLDIIGSLASLSLLPHVPMVFIHFSFLFPGSLEEKEQTCLSAVFAAEIEGVNKVLVMFPIEVSHPILA